MSHPFQKRLLKEYKKLQENSLPGISLVENGANLNFFVFEIEVIGDHPIYKSDIFNLSINITHGYPVDPPQVKFILTETNKVPMHPHIYSNGHICLNLLGTDWTPACSMETILLSIQSMLSTNIEESRPQGDDQYVKGAPLHASSRGFIYDDDTV